MRKMIGLALGTAVAFAASIASAQNAQGMIEEIDPVAKTIIVDGEVYRMPDETTAGVSLEELKVGDRVDITYNPEEGSDEDAQHEAMMVEKIED
jgi:PDZ domain-containing secreted protein